MRHAWKLAVAGLLAATMAGCANEEPSEGGGGGNEMTRDSRSYENSNPVTREQEDTGGALPMQAQPESGQAVQGRVGDQVQRPKTDVVARGGVPTAKVDVNSATVEQLQQVPGISHNLAEAIVNNRPYRNKEDLIRRVPNLDQRQVSSFDQHLTFGPAQEK